jgi:tetratricopeptide (TPR) repeat protein
MNLRSQLELLENAQLVRAEKNEAGSYLFKSPLSQQATYESLLTKSRRELHRCVAEVYERMHAEELDEIAALLAEHYAQAGDDAKTFEYASRAGHAAMRVYAMAEAAANFTLAIEAASRLDWRLAVHEGGEGSALADCYLHRGRAYEVMGQFEKALHNYEEMETLADSHNDLPMKLDALIALATIHATSTSIADPMHARVLSNLALKLAREIGDRKTEARVLWNEMLLSIFLSEMPQAVEYGEQSLAISRELGMREQTALTLNDLGRPYLSLGQLDRARAVLQEALAMFREAGNQPMLVDCLCRFAALNFGIGELDQVLKSSADAQTISENIGNAWGKAFSRIFVGPIYLLRGEFSRACEAMIESVRLGEQSGFTVPLVSARAGLAVLYGALGDVPRGIELAKRAHAISVERLPAFEAAACSALARLEAWDGKLAQAEAHLKRGYETRTDDFALRAFDQLTVASCEIAMARRDYARAVESADESLAWIAKRGFHIFHGELLYLKAQALRGLGNEDAAQLVLLESKAEAERLGSRAILWKIYAALGEKDKARELVNQLVQKTPQEFRASFLALPSVRQVME